MSENEFVAFIGIDWSDKKHDICLQESGSDKKEYSIVKHKPEQIDAWVQDTSRLQKSFYSK